MRPSKLRLPLEHRRRHEIALGHGIGHRLRQRAAVADAGRAAVADEIETELLKRRVQPGLVVVVGHHAAAGGEAGLHVGLDRQPSRDGLLGQQPGGEHDVRVARVRAACDSRDHHGAVADLLAVPVLVDRRRAGGVLLARPKPRSFTGACSDCRNARLTSVSGTRSCGRFGPAMEGSIVPRSSVRTLV